MKHYLHNILFVIVLVLTGSLAIAQVGGTHTYDFLNLTHSAHTAALGGKNVSIPDKDLNFSYHNPAALSSNMQNQLVFNYVNYFADINYGYVSFSLPENKYGNLAAGLSYMNYGKFIEADEYGIITGEFKAADYALHLLYSYKLDSFFSVGVNVKPVFSNLERYTSFGLLADAGIHYYNPNTLFAAGLVVRNVGYQIKGYTKSNHEPLPFEIMLGISQKLQHAPFRFSVTAHHLEQFKLTYDIPDSDEFGSEVILNEEDKTSKLDAFGENLMRHVIFGVELIPFENLQFRVGYNYQRRKEMQATDIMGGVGFSWGFGVNFTRFQIDFGRATYHLAGASSHFSLSTNLSQFYSKTN